MSRTGIKYRLLDQEELKALLDYDSESGLFKWRASNSNRVRVGDVAGTVPAGTHRIIRIGTYNYRASALAWLFVYGQWPHGDVDHRDLNKTNDAINNLREASRSQNNANCPLRRDNKTGFKGVSSIPSSGKFRATIKIGDKQTHLGTYESAEDAHAAYFAKAKEVYGEFARSA